MGQKQLDKDNDARRKKGQLPVQTEYKTKKDDLRVGVIQAASNAKNWDELAYNLRHTLTRQVEQHPPQQRIPYIERQELWSRYKDSNDEFWSFYKEMAESQKEDLTNYFAMLRERNEVDWRSRNRKIVSWKDCLLLGICA